MTRMFFVLCILIIVSFTGCKATPTTTAGVYFEKDWQTDPSLDYPDMRARAKIETIFK